MRTAFNRFCMVTQCSVYRLKRVFLIRQRWRPLKREQKERMITLSDMKSGFLPLAFDFFDKARLVRCLRAIENN
jgi:hypothetical protein